MTSVVVNVLGRSINSAVIRHLKANDILLSSKHGFCSGRSVETNVLESHDHITKLLNAEVLTDMILLDFSIDSDNIYHKQLSIKLHAVMLKKSLL